MIQTRILIDLTQGIIEAEGNEDFVRSIYVDFKDQVQRTPTSKGLQPSRRKTAATEKSDTYTKNHRKAGIGKYIPKIIKDLDLFGKNDKPSLKDFYGQYSTKIFFEKNLIFCYYLQYVIEHTPITDNHVFTCYRHFKGIKTPKALSQSLIDTAKLKGWLDTSSLEDIKVSVAGKKHLEISLKKLGDEN